MITEKLLVSGKFQSGDLNVSFSPSTRKINPDIEEKITQLWTTKKKKADEEGRVCFNGTTYRLNSLEIKGSNVILDFANLKYSVRSILPEIPEYYELHEDYFHRGCHCGATVKTLDNKYLAVELSGKSMNHNKYDLIGGIMEEPSKLENGDDVFDCMYIELEEEARILKSDISDFYLRGIARTAKTFVSFYFEVILKVSSEEILNRFHNEGKDQDIKSLKVMNKEEYLIFLANHPSKTKQTIAQILTI